MSSFDPDAAATGSGIYGLPHAEADAAVVLVPVPFAATVSYGGGAERGPDAILAASRQVDLYDLENGRPYEAGIHLRAADPRLLPAHEQARALAGPIIARGGAGPADARAVAAVDQAGELVNASVHAATKAILAAGRIPGIVGGDHSVPFGAIAAATERHPGLGILHIDAHADLRVAYEGFRWSHASILHNVLHELPQVAHVVQVGVRDVGEAEVRAIEASGGRVRTWFDVEWQRQKAMGRTVDALCRDAIGSLPGLVWITCDIDGLDPALCPHTGTPVPGGLSFAELLHLLRTLRDSGRRIVGFDLVEVAPGDDEWDANVGARVLYKLCGHALLTRGSQPG